MSTLKIVVETGIEAIPVGKPLTGAMSMSSPTNKLILDPVDANDACWAEMAINAAKVASFVYPPKEDPLAAFNFWLRPCGGTKLVPSEIKLAYTILSTVSDKAVSWAKPRKITKGSGKKGDAGNPKN